LKRKKWALARRDKFCYNSCVNFDSFKQFSHAEHSATSEPTVLLSHMERSAAADLFTSTDTGRMLDPTQQVLWQLPDERRLRVVRGGLHRDWRTGGQVMGGLLLIGLLMLTLAHWPAHARHETPSNRSATPAAVSAASPLAVPYATAGERLWTPSAYRPGSQNYRTVNAYRHLALPVPGLPDAYVSTSARSSRSNNLNNGYYMVPPAAPMGIGPSVPHYSY
jgi:hypothetical protein